MVYTDVGGSLEAAWDGQSHVVLRQRGSEGPSFHLSRQAVLELLGLFHERSAGRDDFVAFETYEDGRSCGPSALCLAWSEADVLVELRSKGYPLDSKDSHVAVFKGWPSDGEFTLTWGEVVFRFVARGSEGYTGHERYSRHDSSPGRSP
jgi:hypothetical protein